MEMHWERILVSLELCLSDSVQASMPQKRIGHVAEILARCRHYVLVEVGVEYSCRVCLLLEEAEYRSFGVVAGPGVD